MSLAQPERGYKIRGETLVHIPLSSRIKGPISVALLTLWGPELPHTFGAADRISRGGEGVAILFDQEVLW